MTFRDKLLVLFLKIFNLDYITLATPTIILNSKKEILLGKRADNVPIYPSVWGLPGGIVEKGEKIENASKREIMEELGVKMEVIRKSYNIYDDIIKFKGIQFRSINIPVYGRIKGIPKPKDETSEVKWFRPSEVRKMKLAYNHNEILKGEGLI